MKTPSILVLCTGNSCRSQMAEGILHSALAPQYDIFSAGSKPTGFIHPLAILVMNEIGIDLARQRSRHLKEFLNREINTVITVCGNASRDCPVFPGQVNRYHWGFLDPAHASGTQEDMLLSFRGVRDQIKLVFEAYAAGLLEESIFR